jgi:hypothetical protein
MSDRDDFLSRWSRRKREAAEQATAPKSPLSPQSDGEGSGVGGAPHPDAPSRVDPPHHALRAQGEGEGEAAHASDSEPVFDISKLPSLDSIGPGTDIRMFLQPGVPASLSHAALRRAWSADPAIRDFIGLSENSWDFTAPDQIAGFGPMLPTDNVKEMLAQIFGGGDRSAKEPPGEDLRAHEQAHPEKAGDVPVDRADLAAEGALQASDQAESDPRDSAEVQARHEDALRRTQEFSAMQQEERKTPQSVPSNRRRHGSALPM